MTYILHAILGLVLIVFQTTIRPQIVTLTGIYDVLIAYVLFLGLFRPLKESLAMILVFGFVMDSLSGGPFGLFLTTYFWLVLISRQVTRFLHPDNRVLRFFCVSFGVIVQNGIYVAMTMVREDLAFAPAPIKQAAATQLFWALATGFILVTVFRHCHRKWDDFLGTYFVREVG